MMPSLTAEGAAPEDQTRKRTAMNIDVVELASELIAMPSETPTSNRVIF